MRSDTDIKRDVEAELSWSPGLNETDIAVKVTNHVVTLTGYAESTAEKYRAEAAVKRVTGVAAVANDLAVRTPLGGMPTDPEIAREAVEALKIELPIAWEQIRPVVHQGHVALEGIAEWHDERERAEAAVRRVPGVMSVRNSIKLNRADAPGCAQLLQAGQRLGSRYSRDLAAAVRPLRCRPGAVRARSRL